MFLENMRLCSSCPMKRLAYDGAQGVPIAVPRIWLYIFPRKLNELRLRISSSKRISWSVGGCG